MTEIGGFGGTTDEFEELADALEAAADDVDAATDRALRETALQVERDAKLKAPVDTGNLRASLQAQRRPPGWAVGTNVRYAPAVEFGTGPHVITPNEAEALRFPGPDGDPVFARRVEHPGTPAQPFLRPALDGAEDDLVQRIAAEIDELIEEALNG